ncbi:urease accessory protein UreE [Algirhabdus cladophorae]|uniref:urease accessory protein UreE n=1 Tax=Algirhabdus cladophorae TaxID=3377108 RepID=UPI003B84883C
MQVAQSYHDHGHKEAADRVSLTYDQRFLRRKVIELASGAKLLVDLPQTTSLNHGGVLITDAATEVRVEAAPEELLEITGDLVRLAWHIGNRHMPCQIEAERLLIQRDHVIEDMLGKLAATTRPITAPFTPEGGAYGHGRTHSHAH